MTSVVLKQGRERSLSRRHPWVFSGAVDRVEGTPEAGDTVTVAAADGRFLGRGAFSPASQIRVRIWTFDESEAIDEAFFARRIHAALALRQALGIPERTDAWRLVSAEGDGLPGLVVDRYGGHLVCQFLSAGAERWKAAIVEVLKSLDGMAGIHERSDKAVRRKEGLKPAQGLLWGEAAPELMEVHEDGRRLLVDVVHGHKTGLYLDQRDNRRLVAERAAGREVLNCFAYTGGFGLAALQGGAAHVTNVEDVAGLVELTGRNVALNGLDEGRADNLKADVFKLLRTYAEAGRRFDLVVLDPPKFADSQAQLQRAARGYKDINRLAFKLLRPGGLLFTFSCSGLMRPDLFQKVVADAALDAGRDARLLQWLGQAPDHPVRLQIPETHYLKGLLLAVD